MNFGGGPQFNLSAQFSHQLFSPWKGKDQHPLASILGLIIIHWPFMCSFIYFLSIFLFRALCPVLGL